VSRTSARSRRRRRRRGRARAAANGLGADLRATWRLIRAYLRGDYRDVRLRSVLAVVVAFVYFVSPVDLIPDVFLLLGLTDDLVVVSLLFTVVRQELAGFRLWEQQAFGSRADARLSALPAGLTRSAGAVARVGVRGRVVRRPCAGGTVR
jgi:uncharacterized membrane protein YkvA (DUF1232 family)